MHWPWVFAQFLNFKPWVPGTVPESLARQLHSFSRRQRLVVLVCESVGLVVLLRDKLVAAGNAALQLGSTVQFRVEQPGANRRAADYTGMAALFGP